MPGVAAGGLAGSGWSPAQVDPVARPATETVTDGLKASGSLRMNQVQGS
jgi:hypothetical protein